MTTKKPRSKVVIEDPPDLPDRGRYDWAGISEEIKQNPGKWHKVFDFDSTSLTTMIRNGDVASLRPADGWEMRTANNKRLIEDGREVRKCSLYLRWVKPKRGAK